MKSTETCSLEEFVDSATSSSLSYHTFCLIENIEMPDGMIMEAPVFTVINDYLEELKEQCVTIKLTEDQYQQYKHKPKLLSYYLYGTTELDFLILKLNECFHPYEFERYDIKLVSRQNLMTILTDIKSSEMSNIKLYNDFANAE